ncbi:MAG: alpha/beta hydrolase [Candidatus Obscuribacterales bacterium]|nr:alpha/beta hydrolase [Candidatus Obscuribacterales bacterium]
MAANTPVLNTQKIGSQGHPILLMHGWGQSLYSLQALGELLGKTHQVHLIDLPGFGKSPAPDEDWDTKQYAERIYQYVKENNLKQVDLLGHSFGGRVSIRLTSAHPEIVRSMILINSGGLKRTLTGKRKLRAKYSGLLSKTIKQIDKMTGSKIFENWFVPRFASLDYKNAGSLRNILVKAVTEDVTEDAQKIKNPTFILWGEKDQETPLESGERFHALISGSQFVVLPGKDHFPFLGDGAHLCARYILNFLKTLPGE